jgi:hypothetical protein
MNFAKLRRSRDVPEHHPSKIGKSFGFSSLAILHMAFLATFEQGESVRKGLDLSTRSPAFHSSGSKRCAYIFSGRPFLRLEIGGTL